MVNALIFVREADGEEVAFLLQWRLMDCESPHRPVHIPEKGLPDTEERKAAWTALDIASHTLSAHPDDPQARIIFEQAREQFERVNGQSHTGT